MGKFEVIKGGKPPVKIFNGFRGLEKDKVIVATSNNEAYALLLDAEYGADPAALSVEATDNDRILRNYRKYPVGVY